MRKFTLDPQHMENEKYDVRLAIYYFKAENHVTYFGYLYLYSDWMGEKIVQYSPDTERIFLRGSAYTLSL